jgi:D-glycero-D-manno-heptose 1,7-bisphosphate phosphatase
MKEHSMNFKITDIDNNWSLFLDRDGVINRKIKNGYVLSINDFEFLPGVINALKILKKKFNRILILTNQQCIGKGLISMAEMEQIHDYMLERIRKGGGDITDIFVSPWLEEDQNPYRKPGAGMTEEALKKYPDIDYSRSVMVGDSVTDMLLGRKLGMFNVFISSHYDPGAKMYDCHFHSLADFASGLES